MNRIILIMIINLIINHTIFAQDWLEFQWHRDHYLQESYGLLSENIDDLLDIRDKYLESGKSTSNSNKKVGNLVELETLIGIIESISDTKRCIDDIIYIFWIVEDGCGNSSSKENTIKFLSQKSQYMSLNIDIIKGFLFNTTNNQVSNLGNDSIKIMKTALVNNEKIISYYESH